MKMLLIIYSGTHPERVSRLLDRHGGGYTEFSNAHGSGATGRREGSRAWPGTSWIYFSVLPDEDAAALRAALLDEAGALPGGERLHAAVLPADTYF
jgi:hypothetical protein